jgi:enterochelin esterase-like enzyme
VPKHPFVPATGRIVTLMLESAALAHNLLGDPATRQVHVYLPPDYHGSGADYPLFVDLVGFTGSGPSHLNWKPFQENLPQRLERLVAQGEMGPVVLALPDCFTSLGGNQYINSLTMGLWEDFLIDEMLPRLEQEFRLRPGREHRALFGKSSGGYGAIVHGLKHADVWGAVACHSGDMAFDLVYRTDFPKALTRLAKHDHDIEAFLEQLEKARKIEGDDMHALMILAMAASYDPDPHSPCGIRLPVDPATCSLDAARWQRWLEHDPLRMVEDQACLDNLRRLSGLYLDCGSRDQYHIHYGARAFVNKLKQAGIRHRYEEFDDNHSSIDYRMDVSLPFLYRAVAG